MIKKVSQKRIGTIKRDNQTHKNIISKYEDKYNKGRKSNETRIKREKKDQVIQLESKNQNLDIIKDYLLNSDTQVEVRYDITVGVSKLYNTRVMTIKVYKRQRIGFKRNKVITDIHTTIKYL